MEDVELDAALAGDLVHVERVDFPHAVQSRAVVGAAGPQQPAPQGHLAAHEVEHLVGAVSLERAEYTVQPAVLAGLEPGSLVLWQIEAVLPDNRRIVSKTFATRLE